MCSFDEEELSCESAREQETDAEVDGCSTEATGMDTDARDSYGCDEESDRDDVTGVDEESDPRDVADGLPADFFDPAPWYDVSDLHCLGIPDVYLQNR